MATSSFTKDFVISGRKQVEMFANAIEASANDRRSAVKVSARRLTDPEEIKEFLGRRKKNVGKR